MKRLMYLSAFFLMTVNSLLAQQIDNNKLNQILEKAELTNSEAIIIYQNDELIAEKYFGIGHPDTLIESMSCTKSIVALAMMALWEDGVLDSLETAVYTIYPEWNQGIKKKITVGHLLNMTSGIQNVPNAGKEIYPSPDFVKLALAAELSDVPGTTFSYNNKALNLLAGIVERTTSQKLDKYIAKRIFNPLQIYDYAWTKDEAGNPHVMAGCQLKPRDFTKIGQLVLNKGMYKQKRVLKASTIEKMLRPTDQYRGYGLLWWLQYEKVNYLVDESIVQKLKMLDVDKGFIRKVELMQGHYEDYQAFEKQLIQVFGPNYNQYLYEHLPAGLQIRKKLFIGSLIGYNANGYLGNYLVIIPSKKLVAIRMISHDSYDWEARTSNSFTDFIELVEDLGM
ncbi:MAG: serine hydrolase domain-containing protein [Bacteroidota bacterium]